MLALPLPACFRAACFLYLGEHAKAVFDCREVLTRQPAHRKALFRLGQGLLGVGQCEEAVEVLKTCARAEPQNAAIRGE